MARVLVTGGAGYIGSHTVLALLERGDEVVVLDNFSNAGPESLRRVAQLAGREAVLVEGDVRDAAALARLFSEYAFDSVVHFAGLKAVGESVAQPLRYYDNNVVGTVRLLEAMQQAGVRQLVFSSSATVYGDPDAVPIAESAPLRTTNPYGQSKLVIEQMLRDCALSGESGDASGQPWRIALLRYFNPVGAHASGRIGEDPNGVPNNLLPYIAQVAVGRLACLRVFGDDYATPDGTGVRDYLHVVDLASGHLAALDYLQTHTGCDAFNLGTGHGYSVMEMIRAFEEASGRAVPFEMVERRPGDIASCYADASHAATALGWRAEHSLQDMMRDTWRWQSQNPNGFA